MGVTESLQKQLNKEILTQANGLQCLFRDDNSVIFRRLPIEHACLVEKRDDRVIRAWRHYYRLQYPFNGYKGLPSGMVTLSFERDIILDPHNVLPESERPNPDDGGINDLTRFKDIAASRVRQVRNKAGEALYIDKLTAMLFGFLMLLGIGIIIKVVL